jgi:hypothetical protein
LSTVRDCVRAAQAPTPSGATRKTKLQNALFTASPQALSAVAAARRRTGNQRRNFLPVNAIIVAKVLDEHPLFLTEFEHEPGRDEREADQAAEGVADNTLPTSASNIPV